MVKPRIIILLVFAAVASMTVAAGTGVTIVALMSLVVSGTLASAGAGAFNSYIERDIDGIMDRTRKRPLPTGKITPPVKVLYYAIALSTISVFIAAFTLNFLSAFFIMLGIIVYIPVYTIWLKKRTPLNIVLGGFAGSASALTGWAAATGGVTLTPILIGLLIFLWTPSHFWSLALRSNEDYARAGIPMLPAVVGERLAIKYIVFNTIVMVVFSLLFVALDIFGTFYFVTAMIMGIALLYTNLRMLISPTKGNAWISFKFSSPYLAIIFSAMMIDTLLF